MADRQRIFAKATKAVEVGKVQRSATTVQCTICIYIFKTFIRNIFMHIFNFVTT